MHSKRALVLTVAMLALMLGGIACGSTSDSDQLVRTLVATNADVQALGGEAASPTEVPATAKPAPTQTEEIEGLVKEGTYLVGTDIKPGIYVGLAGEDIFESCYWARLSNLTGSDNILANDNAQGQFYLEVLPDDKALETACELLPLE